MDELDDKMPEETDRRHAAIPMEYDGDVVLIDETIAELIQEVWDAGIETMMSCEETFPGLAWIEFTTVDEAMEFLNIAVTFDEDGDSTYRRAHTDFYGGPEFLDWEFRVNLFDLNDFHTHRELGGPVCFEASIGVYFPVEDIDEILIRVREFNAIRQTQA